MVRGSAVGRIDRPVALGCAAILGAVVSMHFDLLPLINQGWSRSAGLDEAELGVLTGYALGGYALATLSSPAWVRRFRWRPVVALGALVTAGLSVVLPFFVSSSGLPLAFGFLGLGVALVRAPIVTMVGDASHPERAYGVLYTTEMALAIVLSLALAGERALTWGVEGILLVIGGVTLLAVPSVLALPDRGPLAARGTLQPSRGGFLVTLVLLGLSVFTFGVMGPWSFLEHIGIDKGVLEIGSSVVSLALVTSLCGSLVSSIIDDRWGRVLPIALAGAAVVGGILTMDASQSPTTFLIGVGCTNFGWNFALTFSLSLLARVDITGRYVSLSLAAMGLGAAGGAAYSGDVIVHQGYSAFLLASALISGLGFAIVGLAAVLSRD